LGNPDALKNRLVSCKKQAGRLFFAYHFACAAHLIRWLRNMESNIAAKTELHAVSAREAAANGSAICTQELTRHYRLGGSVIRAVDGITLDVQAGEFLAFLGASGSGKSSLLNLLAGLDRPTSGAVFVLGQELGRMTSLELSRHRNQTIGIVFQSFNLLPRMTVTENVELPLRLAEVPRGSRPARVKDALERVGLGERLAHRPGELSGGEQQRVAIARAIVNRPRILLADEPTGNLDSNTGEEILRLISGINRPPGGEAPTTVLMVTHERALAERYAGRIVTLADGRIERIEQR
jgi:putative ABC transport system ATP-binding protein